MKEKKPSWLERYEARQREQVTHTTDINFMPGVPTEDGWYVVMVQYYDREGYDIAKVTNGYAQHDYTILSHAKLPEL